MGEWFDKVTGRSEYERQSWRDSYNGGRAAGDLTGNVNARLDSERDRFQGATWSGSSSQPSALEVAQRGGGRAMLDFYMASNGPGPSGVASGRVTTAGPGVPSVVSPASQAPLAGAGPAPQVKALEAIGPGGPRRKATTVLNIGGTPWPVSDNPPAVSYSGHDWLIPMKSPAAAPGRQLPMGPFPLEMSPYFPPAQVIEDELGEGDFLSPGWFANWGAAVGHSLYNLERAYDATQVKYGSGGAIGNLVREGQARVVGPKPAQEPVDWGQ